MDIHILIKNNRRTAVSISSSTLLNNVLEAADLAVSSSRLREQNRKPKSHPISSSNNSRVAVSRFSSF